MAKRISDVTGTRYASLLFLKKVEFNQPGQHYICLCDCGTEVIYSASRVLRGKVKSCGCKITYAPTRRLPDRYAFLLNRLYRQTVKNQEKHGFPLEEMISIKQYEKIIMTDCFYCGDAPNNVEKDYNKKKQLNSDCEIIRHGVDRLDSDSGYEPLNVVPCCKTCNARKNDFNALDFIWHAKHLQTRTGW